MAKKTAGAASTAANTASELGEGPFAMAIKAGRRPPDSLVQFLDDLHEFHAGLARDLDEAIGTSKNTYRPQFAEALQGEAGDALLAAHDENTDLWSTHYDQHASAARAAYQASHHTQVLQGLIDNTAEAGQEEFNKAVKSRNPAAAMQVWTTYSQQADQDVAESVKQVTQALSGKFIIPQNGPGSQKTPDGKQSDGKQSDNKENKGKDAEKGTTPDASQTTSKTASKDGKSAADASQPGATPDANQTAVKNPLTPGTANGDATQTATPPSQAPSQMPMTGMPASPGGGAGGGRGGGSGGGLGSGMSGLGSSMKPPSGLGSPGGGMSGSGGMPGGMPSGGGMPGGASTSPASASPLANAGSSFQSGLASGMSATGGGGSAAPVSPVSQSLSQQQAAAAFAAQPPAAAAPQMGSTPAGVPMGGGPSGGEMGGGAAQGGSGAAPVGGGGMMPPAGAMAGGPMAPYSAPGAGAAGATPAAPSAPTSPASAGSSSASGGGGPAAGPVMAAGHGSAGAASGLVSSGTEVNPDLLLAQRVLGGLVRACENWPSLIVWAVSVVKTSVGSQIIIATSAGGGGYVPPTVALPTTARLAVVDPVLPFGWAAHWMGCQKPSKILADHFELFRKKAGGAQLSAMVTTELWPQAPDGVQDFLGMQHRDALALVSEAPRLDGGHQHRLAAYDPSLAQRIANLDKGADVSAWAAANLTAAVINAAHAEPDVSGDRLVTDDELAVLQSVHRGTADAVGWGLYDSLVRKRHNGVLEWPEVHAPQDFDGSALNVTMAQSYRKYFRMSQIVELVRCWKYTPPPLADLAYCGIHAGFGSTVVAKVGELEQQLRGQAS
ncbi:hypothetical protein [Mycolicibacterium llatzerense]|uniref:hypothetical protein n=1 Tax=Mycolicibacterium llatzerense TaxID=280871 RepID=UPI00103E895F|nr:hypothetical protein [Mycolicibacterium llatzerense]